MLLLLALIARCSMRGALRQRHRPPAAWCCPSGSCTHQSLRPRFLGIGVPLAHQCTVFSEGHGGTRCSIAAPCTTAGVQESDRGTPRPNQPIVRGSPIGVPATCARIQLSEQNSQQLPCRCTAAPRPTQVNVCVPLVVHYLYLACMLSWVVGFRGGRAHSCWGMVLAHPQ